ncbi:MAG: hypothetical protein ACXV8O_01325 [Methylobacter sp.]
MSGIEHYLESGELPSDPAELARLYQEAIGAEAAEKQVEVDESKGDSTGAATGAEAEKVVEAEKEPDGIATKDGKHIISYDVLKSEREQRQQAVREAESLRAEIERLKNAPVQPDNIVGAMTEEQLADLKEYFPEQYDAIVSQNAALTAAQQKLSTIEQQERQRQAEQQQQVALSVQEEIDNNPVLSHWQRNNPEIFDKCVAMDNMLRQDPNTAALSLSERFEKVASAMTQIYENPIKQADVKADVKVDQKPNVTAKAPKPLINSLSDIPGGEAPEVSETQRLEDSSTAELGDRFMRMTEEQRTAYLNSLS